MAGGDKCRGQGTTLSLLASVENWIDLLVQGTAEAESAPYEKDGMDESNVAVE